MHALSCTIHCLVWEKCYRHHLYLPPMSFTERHNHQLLCLQPFPGIRGQRLPCRRRGTFRSAPVQHVDVYKLALPPEMHRRRCKVSAAQRRGNFKGSPKGQRRSPLMGQRMPATGESGGIVLCLIQAKVLQFHGSMHMPVAIGI